MKPHRTRASRPLSRHRWPAVAFVVFIAAVAAGTALWLTAARNVAAGTPKLVVDRDVVDLGPLAYQTPARVTFTISNQGDGTLRVTDTPRVIATKGC